MIRWIALPILTVALFFSYSSKAADVNFSVGVGDGYSYYPNHGYSHYHPYTYDTYGYYTPRYNYSTSPTYNSWYGNSGHDHSYWRGRDWDNGRRGSWNGSGTYDGRRGGFTSRGSVNFRVK